MPLDPAQPEDGPMVFSDDVAKKPASAAADPDRPLPPWNILIVDDEEGIHDLTRLVLRYFTFGGRPVRFHSAYSGAEAMRYLDKHGDIAVILLDVVMENDDSGLMVVKYLRETLGNKLTRVILRTGQPGSAPEERIITDYDINDYKEKSELTKQKLFTTVTTALRSYRDIVSIQKSREELHKIIHASASIFQLQSLRSFCDGVLRQLGYLLNIDSPDSARPVNGFAATWRDGEFVIMAASGGFAAHVDKAVAAVVTPELGDDIRTALELRDSHTGTNWYTAYFEAGSRLRNLICIENSRALDPMVLDLIGIFNMDVGIAFNNLYLNNVVEDTQKELIFKLGEIVENRSQETSYHVRRVSEYVQLMFGQLGCSPEDTETLRMAAAMHDIGKLGIPDRILMKPDKLDEDEFNQMKTHTSIGHDLMKSSERPIFLNAAEIALCHHERWDGQGYPRGLKGADIPLAARVTAVVDVFDALSMKRVYRRAWEEEAVFEYIRSESGKSFDPDIVALFFRNKEAILRIRNKYARPEGDS